MDKSNVSSFSPDELNRKDVFIEITSQILTGTKADRPRQKTRLNYTYVVIINLLLLFFVFAGGYIVYRIFREQGIKLTVGQGAIQSLELLLAEQNVRRQAEELLKKEEELKQALLSANQINQELDKIKADINSRVGAELEQQKDALAKSIERELQGKSDAEKEAIQLRYQQELAQIEAQYQDEIQRRINEATQIQQEQLRIQEENRKKLEQELAARKDTPAPSVSPVIMPQSPAIENDEVSLLFNSVERAFREQRTNDVENLLKNIERIYMRNSTVFREKKQADLFLISLIRSYISISGTNTMLTAQILNLTNITPIIITNAASTFNVTADIEYLHILIEELALLVDRNPNNPEIPIKIKTLQTSIPDIFTFYNSYKKYRLNFDIKQARPLIKKADDAYIRRNYIQAVQQYQEILQNYPDIPEQASILSNFYQAIYAQVSDRKGLPVYNDTRLMFMKAPDGYIMDIAGDKVVLSLMPGVYVRTGTDLSVFRANTSNGLQLSFEGTVFVSQSGGNFATGTIGKGLMKVGDLIYQNK